MARPPEPMTSTFFTSRFSLGLMTPLSRYAWGFGADCAAAVARQRAVVRKFLFWRDCRAWTCSLLAALEFAAVKARRDCVVGGVATRRPCRRRTGARPPKDKVGAMGRAGVTTRGGGANGVGRGGGFARSPVESSQVVLCALIIPYRAMVGTGVGETGRKAVIHTLYVYKPPPVRQGPLCLFKILAGGHDKIAAELHRGCTCIVSPQRQFVCYQRPKAWLSPNHFASWLPHLQFFPIVSAADASPKKRYGGGTPRKEEPLAVALAEKIF